MSFGLFILVIVLFVGCKVFSVNLITNLAFISSQGQIFTLNLVEVCEKNRCKYALAILGKFKFNLFEVG